MNLISQTEAAKLINVSQPAIAKLTKLEPCPEYFVKNESGVWKIDTDHPEWKKFYDNKIATKKIRDRRNKKKSELKISTQQEDDYDFVRQLSRKANAADLEKIIFNAKIQEEKAKQEELKTAELKKDLAPISLLKHFFSFGEGMLQRWFRRPHEIYPQLEALVLTGEKQKAINLLVNEIEAIVKDTHIQFIESIKKEGYNTPDA